MPGNRCLQRSQERTPWRPIARRVRIAHALQKLLRAIRKRLRRQRHRRPREETDSLGEVQADQETDDDGGEAEHGRLSFETFFLAGCRDQPSPEMWFYTDKIDALYSLLKARQIEAAKVALSGTSIDNAGIEFEQDIEDMFYGARQFGIRDPNGYVLYFIQHSQG